MIMGYFLVRPIPLPAEEGYEGIHDEDPDAVTSALVPGNSSNARLLQGDAMDRGHDARYNEESTERGDYDDYITSQVGDDDAEASTRLRSLSRGAAITHDTTPNLHGKKLWRSGDFWLLFSILSMRTLFFAFFWGGQILTMSLQ